MNEEKVIEEEARAGDKLIEPVNFQPVRSPGNYEAEFAAKGDDIIFHFWPDGYHDAQNKGKHPPRFKKDFGHHLFVAMSATFGPRRLEIENDDDMGAIFVKATGYGTNQFFRTMAISVCEDLHKKLSD